MGRAVAVQPPTVIKLSKLPLTGLRAIRPHLALGTLAELPDCRILSKLG